MYKILVAQGEAVERGALRKLLERNLRKGYAVLETEDGREVVRLCEQEHPQLLLLDIELCGISGLEAARKIRALGENCAIVFMSAYDNFHYAREAISLRAQAYLLKPYTEEELLSTVGESIRLHARERMLQNSPSLWHPQLRAKEGPVRLDYIRKRIEEYIGNNYHSNLSLQQAAEAMNYSDTHFCRLFKQCFDVNFSTYLTDFRVARAKECLLSTMDTVKEVGAACGYTDTSYFIRVFKRLTGMTPSEYRITSGEERKKVP